MFCSARNPHGFVFAVMHGFYVNFKRVVLLIKRVVTHTHTRPRSLPLQPFVQTCTTHSHTHKQANTHAHSRAHTHTHTHPHTHTHTHTRARARAARAQGTQGGVTSSSPQRLEGVRRPKGHRRRYEPLRGWHVIGYAREDRSHTQRRGSHATPACMRGCECGRTATTSRPRS